MICTAAVTINAAGVHGPAMIVGVAKTLSGWELNATEAARHPANSARILPVCCPNCGVDPGLHL